MVTLTIEEFDELTPAERKAHLANEEKIVFGADAPKKKGQPVEQGIGAPGNESENHFRAIEQAEGKEVADRARAAAAKARAP
jgi:hypothetical protein